MTDKSIESLTPLTPLTPLMPLAKLLRDTVASMDVLRQWPTNIQFKWKQANYSNRIAICLCIYEGKELDWSYTVSEGSVDQFNCVTGYSKNARELSHLMEAPGQTSDQRQEALYKLDNWTIYLPDFNPVTVVKCILKDLVEKAKLTLMTPKTPKMHEGNADADADGFM